MRETSRRLQRALRVWKTWAETASREQDGWESDAPNWNEVIAHSQEILLEKGLLQEEITQLETVFCLSEEDETLTDFIKENYHKVEKETIKRLSTSSHPQVRWQVYDSMVIADEFSRRLLEGGVEDSNNYVRRRAFLRLLSTERPPHSILVRAANDTDAVIREQAKQLLG